MIDLLPLASDTVNVLASNYSLYTPTANESAMKTSLLQPARVTREEGTGDRVVRGAGGKKREI